MEWEGVSIDLDKSIRHIKKLCFYFNKFMFKENIRQSLAMLNNS